MDYIKKSIVAAMLIAAASTVSAATATPPEHEHAQRELDKCIARSSVCNVHSDAELIALMHKVQQVTIKNLQARIDKCGLQPGQKLKDMLTLAATCEESEKP